MMKRALVLAASVAVLTSAAHAAPASKPITGNHDNNAPINISSDNFQADLNGKSGTWTGNVLMVQGDTKMRSNQVRVSTVNGKADKVYARAMWWWIRPPPASRPVTMASIR